MYNKPTYIIAEAGVNHNGQVDLAYKLIDAAVAAGVDAVKFQTFRAEKLVTKTAAKAQYQVKNTGIDDSQFSMLKKLELTEKHHFELAAYCANKNIDFLSSAFDDDSLDFLVNQMNVSLLKIPSGEITNAPFILKHALTGKKLILSTGMADLTDIENALGVIAFALLTHGKEKPSIQKFKDAYFQKKTFDLLKEHVTLLHCTTEYPAPMNEINLRVMDTLSTAFNLDVGYSDHSEGIAIPLAAVAKGATVIEKHFTLDRKMEGPDHAASLEPIELAEMVKGIRAIEACLGSSVKRPSLSELSNRKVARKSLIAKVDIKQGETFNHNNIDIMRPGSGVSPFYFWDLLGTVSTRNYVVGDLLDV